jgi:hypothetical protein
MLAGANVQNEAWALGLRADLDALEHPLIGGSAGAEHHPVLAESDWLPVAIGGDVPDSQCGHDISMSRPESCIIRAKAITFRQKKRAP